MGIMQLLGKIVCFATLAMITTQVRSAPSSPSFISLDIIQFLSSAGAECPIPKDSLDQILTSVGIDRTSAGFVPQNLCYRPYPKSEDNVDTDTLGSFCALSFETLRALCRQKSDSQIQTVAVPPSSSLSVKEVCGVLAQWILNAKSATDDSTAHFGEHCNRTCSGNTRLDGSADINKQCYDLYYGRMLLSEVAKSSNPQLPDAGGSNVPLQTSPSGTATSAAQRRTTATEVPPTAAVTNSQLVDGEMMRSNLLEQYNLTQTSGNGTAPVESVTGSPGLATSRMTSSAGDPAAHPAQTSAPSPPKPPPFSATGMSPGVIVPGNELPKLPGFPSGPAGTPAKTPDAAPAAAQTTSKVDGAPDLAGNLTPLDASAVAGDKDALSADVAGNEAPAILPGGSSPSQAPASGVAVSPAAVASSSRRPPVRPEEIPPPPPAVLGGPVTSSTSSAPPAAGSLAVADQPASADSAPAAPPAGEVDPGKLPVGQEIVGDDQDVDYEDPSVRYETGQKDTLPAYESEQKPPPAAAAGGADDFSLDGPRQLYKAPSGLQPMDDLSGVSPFKPLREQGGSESNFFAYFLTLVVLVVVVYIVFHNKKKIMALIIEGRQSSGRRRPYSSQYRKLDSSLEEAVTSQQRQQIASNIIY